MTKDLLANYLPEMSPEDVLKEIEMSMVRAGVTRLYFNIKTLTPIYPFARDRLTNEDFYQDVDSTHLPTTHLEIVEHETEIDKAMKPVL